ncbi:MAG: hypothetical protein JNM85_02545 [Chthonomonas sp.]|nr:hypothetical protein [Chthonomonas sp.]
MRLFTLLCSIAAFGLTTSSHALILWKESVNGDLSNNRLSPTALTLAGGVNVIQATTSNGDREYFSLKVPVGCQLDKLILSDYVSNDMRAFIGFQKGTTMTVDPNAPDPSALLGYAHFGPGGVSVGNDLLPAMATGFGAIGFTTPLPAGDYTYWVNQLGASTNWEMQWHVSAVPEPAAIIPLTMGVLAIAVRLRRPRTR